MERVFGTGGAAMRCHGRTGAHDEAMRVAVLAPAARSAASLPFANKSDDIGRTLKEGGSHVNCLEF
jgi:hypothetical protein